MSRFGAARAGLLATLLLATVACGETPPSPGHLFAPDGVGVIRETERLATGERVTLESGKTFDLGTDAIRTVESGAGGDPGDLVIYGEDNGQPWVSTLRADTSWGGWVLSGSAWERPDDLVFVSGMVLPKSPEFRVKEGCPEASEDGFHAAATFVTNERGEVILVCGAIVG